MKVGLMLPMSAQDGDGGTWAEISALARHAEAGGIDSLWLSDHFVYRSPDGSEAGSHEAWTLLSALAAVTVRVELGTLVLATSFRQPGLLAKMAVTADDVSGGRLILGLGCGWHEPEYRAFGYPFDHRVGRFDEALRVIVPLVRGERVTLNGTWTTVEDAVLLPPPRRPSLPILVAAKGDRMLRLTAHHADSWQTAWFGLPDPRFAERRQRFIAACEAEGRDPDSVEVTVGLELGGDDSDHPPGWRGLPLDPAAIGEGLAAWAAEGVGHVQIGLVSSTRSTYDIVLDGLRRFAKASGSALG
jgi:probable F420-dependent oxidoreductase